ncbi:MAG: MmcQ/YjbR family DNA-binding protein [Calditrichia bacterium]|nr:MmcQ/YjbR family DNA-binding protein [Calditrichia bacterium]
MNLEKIRKYLLSKPETTEELPFGPEALVFKVAGKMFALIAWEQDPIYISMKCDPERAVALREIYPAIKAAYHFNKTHWNMVYVDGTLTDDQVTELIDHSYDLVVKNLKKSDRDRILNINKITKSKLQITNK